MSGPRPEIPGWLRRYLTQRDLTARGDAARPSIGATPDATPTAVRPDVTATARPQRSRAASTPPIDLVARPDAAKTWLQGAIERGAMLRAAPLSLADVDRTARGVARTVAEMLPGPGDLKAAVDAGTALREGRGGAAALLAASVLPGIPSPRSVQKIGKALDRALSDAARAIPAPGAGDELLRLEHRTPHQIEGGYIRPGHVNRGPIQGKEYARQSAFPELYLPRSYHTAAGEAVESGFENLPVFHGELLKSRVYDLRADPHGVVAKANEIASQHGAHGSGAASVMEQLLQRAGYEGYRVGPTVAAFTPVTARPDLSGAVARGLEQGGFTLDPRTGKMFAGTGFAVADPKATLNVTEVTPQVLRDFLDAPHVREALQREGAHLGGWRDPQTGQLEINVTDILPDEEGARRLGVARQQKAVGRLEGGAYAGDVALGPEQIKAAAVRAPNGRVFTGPTHGHALSAAEDAGFSLDTEFEQGWKTDRRDFLLHDTPEELALSGGKDSYELGLPFRSLDTPTFQRRGTVPRAQRKPDQILSDYLLPDETADLGRRAVADQFKEVARLVPDPETFASGALAGQAKRGWYEHSAEAIRDVFGDDAPMFANIVAALSPQTSVENNLTNALQFWGVWNAAGRPTDARSVVRALKGAGVKSLGESWENNLVRAVNGQRISGPKVASFYKNLTGDDTAVTLDTWMAKLANFRPKALEGRRHLVGGDKLATPHGAYLAYAAQIRRAADQLGWKPAEVQETLWSFGKTLGELVPENQMARIEDFIPQVTPDLVRQTPDFSSLLGQEPYRGLLAEQGLRTPQPRGLLPMISRPPDPVELRRLANNLRLHSMKDYNFGWLPVVGAGALAGRGLLADRN